MKVIYDFDRLQENTPDSYSAAAPQSGFELGFNDRQVLEVIWCHVQPHSDFAAVELDTVGTTAFHSFDQAMEHARRHCMKISQAKSGEGWIRHEHDTLWIHYEFQDGRLDLITLMSPRA